MSIEEAKFYGALRQWSGYNRCIREMQKKGCRFLGLSGSGKIHFVTELMRESRQKIVYVAANDLAARCAYEDFLFLTGGRAVLAEPAEYMLYDVDARSSDAGFRRMEALAQLLSGDWDAAVMSVTALIQWMPDPEQFQRSFITVVPNQKADPTELAQRLAAMGYERAAQVSGRGQFSLRGDILDVFHSSASLPVRIEFFDDTVDSVRIFDHLTQRTVQTAESVTILPDHEITIQDTMAELRIREKVEESLEYSVQSLLTEKKRDRAERLRMKIHSDMEKLSVGRRFGGFDRYIPFITGKMHTILDYTGRVPVFLDEPEKMEQTIQSILEDHVHMCETIAEHTGLLQETYAMHMDYFTMRSAVDSRAVSVFEINEFGMEGTGTLEVPQREITSFSGNMTLLLEQLRKWKEEQYQIIILAGSESKTKRMREFLQTEGGFLSEDNPVVLQGGLHGGFRYPDCKLAIVSDHAFFRRDRKALRGKKNSGSPITSFADMKPGDLVVHEVHGVGRFQGIESMRVDNVTKDYLKIIYREDGVLYVPTHQLSSVQKYIGPENSAPKLNKLGGSEWERTTSKVKDSLRTYARDLVELYARRANLPGFSFSDDTVWQNEFEEGFPYTETEDQIKCVEEIKSDMMLSRPMERLLCGDVGYGKTEVALRAAFKAICGGKQVAFLVPTTVLAQQHYHNFIERFKDFPVRVDYLCRFRTEKEKQQIMKSVQKGEIDLLVGTHSILAKKLVFRDLGLVIVDEEQRFGVMHKEKLKLLYPSVDILTLSATPIPRTLHMSLSGIRDISVLEEPPNNRHPVQTYVTEWTPEVVRNAIYRELGRKGQIFYLYNRVRTIEEKRRMLEDIVPEARVVSAHGQMSERELEDAMAAFLRQDYDVLLCTTIIESGLDMPNVNTVIIEDGDHLGLAQLYQIRGRVGRSDRLAYAYVTYKKDKELTEIAEKRLRTIREFTEFGAGFKIAMRDLELRGAGSVLGEKQHGQLATVGYDMYCRLLNEVVNEEKGMASAPPSQVHVEFQVQSHIPSDFIEEEESRLDLYKRIAGIQSREDISELTDELIDRFGEIPQDIVYLMHISFIRFLAEQNGFTAVIQKPKQIVFLIRERNNFSAWLAEINEKISASRYKSKVLLNMGNEPYLSLQCRQDDVGEMLKDIVCFLSENFYLPK